MERKRRPGFLTQYALHAGISKPAAAEQLKRVGINYMASFNFAEADRLREAMRHADRAPFAKPIYVDPNLPPLLDEPDPSAVKDPAFAEIQRRREHFRAELARLDYEQRIGKLVEKSVVQDAWFRICRQVRDAVKNVSARLEGPLAAETDQRRVREMLDKEHDQALEALADNLMETGGPSQ